MGHDDGARLRRVTARAAQACRSPARGFSAPGALRRNGAAAPQHNSGEAAQLRDRSGEAEVRPPSRMPRPPESFGAFAHNNHALVVVVGILSLVVVLSMTAGLAGLTRVLARRRPVIAVLASAVMVQGFLAYLIIVGTDNANAALALSQPETVLAAALDASTKTVLFNAAFVLFLIGHVLGPVLMCIAVWRSNFAPWPVALLLPVGAIGHLVAEVVSVAAADIAAFAVFGAGFAALGYLMLRPWRL
ncbi:DUF4386 family protein [Sinomonas sp. JGH33]|uniref:DUF4386 family protein n=1 Tax=Sinomonas terricola TaxID=3110330 RepID=A0ABU5T4Z8_9MICC|nr:DUF4386 family protein [Sinomonas sp. JGH33]MEA5454741.1 DUF4386 family protein [Sinomonas sp. JGH33]